MLQTSLLQISALWGVSMAWISTNTGKIPLSLTLVLLHWATWFSETSLVSHWNILHLIIFLRNLSGSVADGVKRPSLYLVANDLSFATNVTVEDFSVWTESGTTVVNKISNIFGTTDDSYGSSNGIKSLGAGESPSPYSSTYTITASPTGWKAPATPTWAVPSTGYGSKLFASFFFAFSIRSLIFLQRHLPFRSIVQPLSGAQVVWIMICITGEASK